MADWLKNPPWIVLALLSDFDLPCTNLLHSFANRFDQQPEVSDCSARRVREHPGAGMAHHFTYLLAIIWLVAVHGTFGTDWLIRHKLTDFQPLVRVGLQLPAFLAQPLFLPVFISAVQTKHERDRFFFGVQNLFFFHEEIILAHLLNLIKPKVGHDARIGSEFQPGIVIDDGLAILRLKLVNIF